MRPIFVTGIGTSIGKTLVAAVLTEALKGDYWKPVQAGFTNGTDSQWVKDMVSHEGCRVYPELYKLKLAASPHIAAREEGVTISLEAIGVHLEMIRASKQTSADGPLIIEGAGGLLVPLNAKDKVIDLIERLNARVILVSRNYLGSINHSLLTAQACQARGLEISGWVFNDQYLHYESEIVDWTNIPAIYSIPFSHGPDRSFVHQQADLIKPILLKML
jgi:dethiobiotin synthetase